MTGEPAGGGRIAARFVALDGERCIAPGEVVWDASGRIVALRRARGRVADVCVLPGLVNAHAHLQLEPLARPERRFVPWITAVLAARAAATPARERAAVRRAVHDLLATGTTAVGDIDSSGASAAVLARSPLGGRCYRELTGFHLDDRAARALVRERLPAATARVAAGAIGRGLSPHAPYSVSPALFRAAARASRHLAIHCAEVAEEQQFLRSGRGPFAELLTRLQRLPPGFRAPGVGAVRWLEQLGVLLPTTLLVHCQQLERGDPERIAAAGAKVVVCPGTIEYFRREPPPVAAWLAAGIPVALGTDSRASNRSLSMRDELRAAARLWPRLSPEALLTMATSAGGRALGRPGLGALRPGGRADLLVVPADVTFAATVATFVHGGSRIVSVVCGGRTRRAAGHTGR